MIGKIFAAFAGAEAAKGSSVGGTGGALLGVAGATLLKRLSLPALIVLTAGGYAFKKWNDRREPEAPPKAKPRARRPRKAAPKPA